MQGKKDPKFSPGEVQVFHDYRSNCRKRNIFFDLSMEEIVEITQKNCYYCNKAPKDSNARHGKYFYNGIDRKDNKKGYTPDNVLPCCKECNGIRSSTLTVEEMQAVAIALKKFRLGDSN